MAITHIEYALLRRMREQSSFPANPSVLELGQSNWYGDISIDEFVQDIRSFVPDDAQAEELVAEVVRLAKAQDEHWLFHMADIFWQVFLGDHGYKAIDFDGIDDRALKYDLNEPVPLDETFDIVCNFGTAEHVFNIYQVFKSVHELTKPGGWMLHGLPFQGWVDHGFYTVQPTLFFDLAEANGYGTGTLLYAEIQPPKIVPVVTRGTVPALFERSEMGSNPMLFAAFRKMDDEDFKVPMQGYYGRRLDAEAAKRWESLR